MLNAWLHVRVINFRIIIIIITMASVLEQAASMQLENIGLIRTLTLT